LQEEAFLEAGNVVAKKTEAGDGTLPTIGHVCATEGRALGETAAADPEATKVGAFPIVQYILQDVKGWSLWV